MPTLNRQEHMCAFRVALPCPFRSILPPGVFLHLIKPPKMYREVGHSPIKVNLFMGQMGLPQSHPKNVTCKTSSELLGANWVLLARLESKGLTPPCI